MSETADDRYTAGRIEEKLDRILELLEMQTLPDIDRPSREELGLLSVLTDAEAEELLAERADAEAAEGLPPAMMDAPTVSASAPALLRYPPARRNEGGRMRTRGRYRRGYPEGAIVHFTAGRDNPLTDISVALNNGYCYFTVGPDGTVYQNFDLDRWGAHAGKSEWPGLGEGVSRYLVGIEICNCGLVRPLANGKFRPWYNEAEYLREYGRTPKDGDDLPADRVRFVETKDNRKRGHYEKYTEAQETALLDLLRWLRRNNPAVFSYNRVLGHDEVSPDRKNDPGGALSLTMRELRRKLLDEEEA